MPANNKLLAVRGEPTMFESTPQATVHSAHQAAYDHTQWGPACWLILAPAIVLLPIIALVVGDPGATLAIILTAAILLTTAFSFRSLRIVDEGDKLALRYGPLPIFHKRFAYSGISAAERDRSSAIDGWGIHWVPGRGWTYNIWGLDCVRLTLTSNHIVRIGTDNPEGLEKFLKERIRRG
jgi:hypothetical protein